MYSVKAPGKLYISGEYSVVENGYPSVITSVNKYLRIDIEEKSGEGRIFSDILSDSYVSWNRDENDQIIFSEELDGEYIKSAMDIVEKIVLENGKKLKYYNLRIDSELNNIDGKKFGLGSSAAVTVATVRALNELYELSLSNLQIYKLASLIHISVQGNGSFGDIASSTYGGIIAYTSPDKKEVNNLLSECQTISEVINQPWKDLNIEYLSLPSNLDFLVGWTGKPASTGKMLKLMDKFKLDKQQQYQKFLSDTKACVLNVIQGFKESNIDKIKEYISFNRVLLNKLAEQSVVEIETPLLRKLCDISEENHASAKISGAGGGDCGIAFVEKDNNQNLNDIKKEWESEGIVILNLGIGEVINYAKTR
ncbi:phosphomevalonate kinase [Lactobacillus terrae]|uniref:phosphomevalonate kinase n=1 Tax=Lactobacillus terrae TaxID=2269374 RepID=UPI000C1B672D|nr:phosphomevalonate kinase [Lactobacillus terrae]